MISQIQYQAVYSKLEDDLRQDIICNNVDFEKPLPGELELCEKYSISRKSVRKALENLCAEGLLSKIQGKGTFAIPPQIRIPLMSAKKLNILLIIPWFYAGTTEYDEELIKGISSYVNRNNHSLEFSDADIDPEEIILKHKSGEINGIIWDRPSEELVQNIVRISNAGVPIVTTNRMIDGISCLSADHFQEVNVPLKFLFDIGHRSFLFINGDETNKTASLRKKYFYDTISEFQKYKDINAVYVECREKKSMKSKLDEAFSKNCTAVFAGGFSLLGVVLNFCRKNRIIIPADISLICINDSLLARSYSQPVTIFTEPRVAIGEKTVELLENIIADKILKYDSIKMEGELIMRKSCGLPKKYGRIGQ